MLNGYKVLKLEGEGGGGLEDACLTNIHKALGSVPPPGKFQLSNLRHLGLIKMQKQYEK